MGSVSTLQSNPNFTRYMKRTILKKIASQDQNTCSREPAMNTQPTLPSSPGHLLKVTKGPIFIAIIHTSQNMCAFVCALETAFRK